MDKTNKTNRMNKINSSNNIHIIGIHKIIKHKIATSKAVKFYDEIMKSLGINDIVRFRYYLSKLDSFIISKNTYKNIVVDVGRNIICELLLPVANRSYSGDGIIAYGSLGNDSTAPSTSDTLLGNETYRKAITDSSVSGNVLNVLTFWNLTEANAQHYEAGEFIDGSATLDTGNLFSHWNIDENKTSSETLSIDSYYTITL